MIDGVAPLTQRQIWIVFGGVMAGMFLSALDSNILSTALPTIVNEFEGGKQFAWVGTAYMLTSTAATPLFGKLSDQYGRRLLFQIAIIVFVVGSVACAAAQSMNQLIAARGLQGIGGGGLFALAFAIIGDVIPPRERGRYVGFMTSVFTMSSIVGPLLGGVIVDNTSWRWIFLINVPLGIGALLITSSALRLPWVKQPHKVDYIGATLLVGGVCSLILAMAWAGDVYGWTAPTTLGLLSASAVLTAVFIWWETKAPEPIVPLRLFTIPTIRAIVPIMAIGGAVLFGATAFVPLFLQAVTGLKATWAGLLMSPFAIGVAVGAIITGRRTATTGRYKAWPIVGLLLTTAGMLVMSTLHGTPGYVPVAMVGMALAGLGLGSLMPVGTMAAQNAVEWQDLGVASSTVLFFRQLGGVVGIALFGAILNSQISDELDPSLVRQPLEIRALPTAQRDAALEILTNGITTIFKVAAPLAALGVLLALRLPELPLRTTSALQRSTESVPSGHST